MYIKVVQSEIQSYQAYFLTLVHSVPHSQTNSVAESDVNSICP